MREITRPLPVTPPGPGAVIAGRYVLSAPIREDPPGVFLYAGADQLLQVAPVWLRLHGQPASAETGAEFLRAAGQVRALGVAGLAPLLDLGHDHAAGLFVVEDLGPGVDLATSLRSESLPVLEAVRLLHHLASSLARLHRAGLAHGAIRPEVVILGPDGGVDGARLADATGRSGQRATGRHAPPTPFDAPEQDPARPATAAEDVFSIGALLYFLVAGRLPDEDATGRPLSDQCPDVPVPQALDQVVRRCLAADPEARYRGAEELRGPLSRAVADLAGPAGGEARPTELGRYSLVKLLARGGMGEIFLARVEAGSAPRAVGAAGVGGPGSLLSAMAPRICAIKRIRGEYAADEERVSRFVAEARLAARLQHDNIVSVYDLGRTGEDFFIVMEYVAGKNLRELLGRARDRGHTIPVEVALHVAREVCRGLVYVHGFVVPGVAPEGLVHRDVSPQNVLLAYDGRVKLIDFGLARGGLGAPKTSAGVVVGKLCYLSPEQARGQVATSQSDVYAAGLVLWELLCGRPIFNGEPDEVARQVINPRFEAPSRLRPEVPPPVDRICARALAVDCADRYPSAAAMAADLERALGPVPRGELARRAGRLCAEVFAGERHSEEVMARAAMTAPPLPRAAPPVEAHGRSLLSDSAALVMADTTVTAVRFDWDALAESLSGLQPLPDKTTRRTELPWLRSWWMVLILVLGAGVLAAVVTFFVVMAATGGPG